MDKKFSKINFMKIFDYSVGEADKILEEFGVDPEKGLDSALAAKREAEFGLNRLALRGVNAWHIFLRQFKSAFVYLMLGAMAITVFLGENIDTLMIFIFLAINVGLGFFQEYRSEKTAKLLSRYTLPRSKVLRNGRIEQIVSEKIVPGDIVILETGDKIPADVRFIEENNLTIDETILTGESIPVCKKADALLERPEAYHEALNLGFSGTDVLKGKAKGLVLSTGRNTAFGKIATLTVESRKVSDFEKGISRFSKFIIKLVAVTLFVVFFANILIKGDGVDTFHLVIFAVALTVSVIPQALPLVTTFSLAQGARRLAKNKVIVKRLSAIEDLGGIEILCSDKTGTLTKNELTVANIFSDNPDQTLFLANVASSFDLRKKIEPFDIALDKELSSKQKQRLKKSVKIAEEPFDPKTKRNVVLARVAQKNMLITRGAPENIIEMCVNLDGPTKKNINDWMMREGEQGHRVLAIAYREEEIGKKKDFGRIMKREKFNFAGVVSFVDPIKRSSFKAVVKAKELGVRIVVITGDSPEVAGAVGCEIGLIDSPDKVISGTKWERMTEDQQERCLEEYSIFARVSPEQKFKIVKSLRERHTVGFLGEGINDAPALKISGVSLVVDSAADIAREAADIVLLKKNLEIILDGVREGRRVFANTTKYIKSTLASNFGNFFAIATASLLIDFLPMLPVQILLVNLLTDTPMISVSSDSVDSEELASPKKYEVKDIVILSVILGIVSMVFDFIFFGTFFRISPEVLRTNWFIGSILTELALIFSVRTKSLFVRGTRPSKSLTWLSLTVFAVTVGLPFTHFGQSVFHFIPPSGGHMIFILSLVAVYFVCSEIVKLFYFRSKMKNSNSLA